MIFETIPNYIMMDNSLPILSSVSPLLQSEVVTRDADGEGEDDGGALLHGDRVQGLQIPQLHKIM